MKLLIDTNILGKLCHPNANKNKPIATAVRKAMQSDKYLFVIPEIVDYELRRKYLHLTYSKYAHEVDFGTRCLTLLDSYCSSLVYLEINTAAMKKAAHFWGNSRANGKSTSDEKSLDADVILAAQATLAQGQVLTENVKHLSLFVATKTWQQL